MRSQMNTCGYKPLYLCTGRCNVKLLFSSVVACPGFIARQQSSEKGVANVITYLNFVKVVKMLVTLHQLLSLVAC